MLCVMNVNSKHYVAKNRYWCPTKIDSVNFENVINKRKKEMAKIGGFISCDIILVDHRTLSEPNGYVYECKQAWNTDKDYQTWMTSKYNHTSNFDTGIYQFVPENKKISIPETYMPFIDVHGNFST